MEFLVHKEAVFHHCGMIKTAVQTSGSARYHLSDATPGSVRFLLQWLYSQKITVQQLDGTLNLEREGHTGACTHEDLALVDL